MLIAIYSRKSKWTGKGESVENQLIMCREYIAAFVEGGKEAEIIEYEDEGFSGKNTKRPQFQKMMKDLQERHFDYLVCYKLDRLGRNLADLAALMEKLEKRNTSFISIKEKFDTTTPIGKAMLYFSGVLAQMEREQIAERVRDNMVMLARSGRWLGGNTPLGFDSQKQEKEAQGKGGASKTKTFYSLVQNDSEIELAKFIFSSFIEKRSLSQVMKMLLTDGIKTRGGNDFSISGIRDILTNPVYCKADEAAYQYFYDLGCQVCIDREELDGETGLISYAKTSSSIYKNQSAAYDAWIIAMGRHRGIIDGKDFVQIQTWLEENREKGDNFRRGRNNVALLSGVLRCTCGYLMRPKNYPANRLNERGERTFAYLCPQKDHTHGVGCQNKNVHGNTLDDAVCEEIMKIADPDQGVLPLLEELKKKIASSDDEILSEKQLFIQEREKKKEQIGNLIHSMKKMELDSVSVGYIKDEIAKLDGECRELDKKIEAADEGSQGKSEIMEQLEEAASWLTDFRRLFWNMNLQKKRDFLRSVIEKVVWDGELAHIYLKSPVHEKHRAVFMALLVNFMPQSETKYPFLNHRIAAAGRTDDRQKFSFPD